tara:strand:- start:30386 stop:30535 length:150 start_codon:yes stop_codon:yes gene_type:complete
MSQTKSEPLSSPFPMSEQELAKRMEHAKPLSDKQFIERIKQIRSEKKKG